MERRRLLWIFLTCEVIHMVASEEVLGYRPTIASTTTTTPSYQPELCPLCYCGLTNTRSRILGGLLEYQVNETPWVAFLLYKGRYYCDASVINNKYVLTAAHCVDRFQKEFITVRISDRFRDSPNITTPKDFSVTEILEHTSYSAMSLDNDIALIKIDGEFEFDHKMKPACLAQKGKSFSGEEGFAIGWENTTRGGSVSTTLREATMSILSDTECRATKYGSRKVTDNMLCAGRQKGQNDSCQGGAGELLHVQSDGLYRIVGVATWGEGCPRHNFPNVYTRVDRYIDWILRNTQDACYCSEDKNLRFKASLR